MLSKITLHNFKSFKEKTIIDLTKTNYAILPQNATEDGLLKGCMFVGANASGKSNIILSVKLLLDMLFSERTIHSGLFRCMFGDPNDYTLDYEFKIEAQNIRYSICYNYVFERLSESLYIDGKQLLYRVGQTAEAYITGDKMIYDEHDIPKDTLFLRTLYFNTKFSSNKTLSKWMEFLKNSIYINMFNRKIESYGRTDLSLESYLKSAGCDKINQFFNEYHFEQTIEYSHSSQGPNYGLSVGENESDKSIFFRRDSVNCPIPFAEESMGNQNLLRMLPAFISVIENGGMLLIDEFSSGFHNQLEKLLVRYFMQTAKKAQMIFVSHSTNLLSNAILRPDQEYTVEFYGGQGSRVHRVSDEQPRAAQNIEKMYNSGVFGGIPMYQEVIDEN